MRRWCWAAACAVMLSGCNPKPPAEPGGEQTAETTASQPEPPVEEIEATVVTVYFADSEVEHLEAEAVDAPIAAADPASKVASALTALLAGPTESAHTRLLPASVKLKGVKIRDGVATVDLSQALVDDFQGGSGVAQLAIDSIVNTVCAVDGIQTVQILVEGQTVSDFAGVLSLAEPLEADLSQVGGQPL